MIFGYRRGSVRLWRTRGEAYKEIVIWRRWKGFSKFIFQSYFSWDSKGPYYIWRIQSITDRKKDDLELAKLNKKFKATKKAEQKLSSSI